MKPWSEHELAVNHEQYTHDVARFRLQFHELLTRHNACKDGNGWAMFTDTEDNDETLSNDREILLHSSQTGYNRHGFPVPMLRIITNESSLTEELVSLVAEDVTILPNNQARYAMSGVQVRSDSGEDFQEAVTSTITPFMRIYNRKLAVSPNFQLQTPINPLDKCAQPSEVILPYGDGSNLRDAQYAVAKASLLLSKVSILEPHDIDR